MLISWQLKWTCWPWSEIWHLGSHFGTRNRKQIPDTREKKKKQWKYLHFSDNNVPRYFFSAFTAAKQEERRRDGSRKRHKQERQTRRNHFDEKFTVKTFPTKGRRAACLLACLARHLQKSFSSAGAEKCKVLCVYRINGWRRFPLLVLWGKR